MQDGSQIIAEAQQKHLPKTLPQNGAKPKHLVSAVLIQHLRRTGSGVSMRLAGLSGVTVTQGVPLKFITLSGVTCL